MPAEIKRERGSTIERVLDIIDTVAASTKPLSATDINQVLDLPKATAHRLCAQLEARGYLLKRIDGKTYQPGNRLFDVAVGVLASSRFGATGFLLHSMWELGIADSQKSSRQSIHRRRSLNGRCRAIHAARQGAGSRLRAIAAAHAVHDGPRRPGADGWQLPLPCDVS